jgi:DNA-binding GntR family transcriptional regulator
MAVEAPISRAVLSKTVKDRLIEAVLDGRYPPGSRIVETRVAREFGTSQTPVREALRDLEALGLVEISAFRGARVRRPTREELVEALIVRAELEALVVGPLAGRLSDGDVSVLEGYLSGMRRSVAEGDVVTDAAADVGFHTYLVELTGNRTLVRAWRLLEPHARTYMTLTAPGSNRHHIAELHAPILDALRANDRARADAAIREHFDVARAMLIRGWPDASSAPPTEGTR